jgi:hypothetical protein
VCELNPVAQIARKRPVVSTHEPKKVKPGFSKRAFKWVNLCRYCEEMDRDRGFWWHPDGTAVAFTRVDTSAVPIFKIQHQGANLAAGTMESHSYPFAGRENARVRLGVVDVSRLVRRRPSGDGDDGGGGKWKLVGGKGKGVNFDDDTRAGHDTFEVTWMDVDCGPASLGGRGGAVQVVNPADP